MDPTVVAAVIAASASILTLIGTVIAQVIGFRSTKADTEQQIRAQSEQLDRTLAEDRTRTWNERFATAAGQLGDDKPAAVRLAGVYAMAGLADDWEAGRQTCVDVLCAYLRMPYRPDPGEDITIQENHSFQAIREIRHTVIRVITAHLREDAAVSWQGLDFDFTGVVFDGGDFYQARFSGGTLDFRRARFSGGRVDFTLARFSGSEVNFLEAEFSGGLVNFDTAEFSAGTVDFSGARFSGGKFSFHHATFSGGEVDFLDTDFSGGEVGFTSARFSAGTVDFVDAKFSGGAVGFGYAEFSGSKVGFNSARFSAGMVDFRRARFSGGTVDFSNVSEWSYPPKFPWKDTPLSGVKLPSPGAT